MNEHETPQSIHVEIAPTGVIDALARMPEKALLNEKAMAGVFGVTPRTIRRMVGRHEIPPGIPLAGKTVWMAGKVLEFLEGKLEQAEKSAERRRDAFLRNTP